MYLSLGHYFQAIDQELLWSEVFDRARKKDKVVQAELGPFRFEYALIHTKDRYGSDRLDSNGDPYTYTGWDVSWRIREELKHNAVGINVPNHAFVFAQALKNPAFADYVGLHEYVEAEGATHKTACLVELSEVLHRDPVFVENYAGWIIDLTRQSDRPEKGYFGRAVPDFEQTILTSSKAPADLMVDFYHQLIKNS